VLLAFFSYKANDSGKKSDTKMFEKHRSAKVLTATSTSFGGNFSRASLPYTPCDRLYLVPALIGC